MKKMIACLLTLAMLIGIVPVALAVGDLVTSQQTESVKVLTIGDKFTRSGMEYLYKIFQSEGYTDITLGYLYKDKATVADYAGDMTNKGYTFARNTRDYWDMVSEYSVQRAVEDRDWDYIVLQTVYTEAGDAATISTALDMLVPFINEHKTNPDARIGWHVNWPGKGGTTYAAIAAAAQTLQTGGAVDMVIPAGTAIMNIATSFIGEEALYKDSTNLSALGELAAGYAWYAALTGNDSLSDLAFDDAFQIHLSSAQRKVIAEAASNAVKSPYAATTATYTTKPTQYDVTVNGAVEQYMAGDTVTITADKAEQRGFQKWTVLSGGVTLADAKASTTTFTMPAKNVEVKAVCAGDSSDTGNLKVGWGRADATPILADGTVDGTIHLAGNFDTETRIATGTATTDDGLNMTAIALSDGTQTNIVMTTDFIRVPTAWSDKLQDAVMAELGEDNKYGLTADRISISATHTHSSVDIGDAQSSSYVTQSAKWHTSTNDNVGMGSNQGKDTTYFTNYWLPKGKQAILDALADLSDVSQTKVASVNVPGMNWVRHWRYSDGTMAGTNFGGSGGRIMGHNRNADPEMQLIRFVRNDKKDVVLVNWQAHPTGGMGGDNNLRMSADYCGVLYRYLEAQDSDCLAAFFQGAAGNVEYYSSVTTERERWSANGSYKTYGTWLGEYALEALNNMRTVETGEIQSLRVQSPAVERGYSSTRTIEQDVVTVGSSIAFVTAGYEMFDSSGMFVKENSPYDITFVIENAQGHEYMPDWQATQYSALLGGEAAYEAREGQFNEAPGTAEDLADGLVKMLNKLYNQ